MKTSSRLAAVLPTGEEIYLYTLENENGMRAEITNVGCAVQRLWVPDKSGAVADVVLGYEDPASYAAQSGYFGVVVGRNANRIAEGSVDIAGTTYSLEQNNGRHNLHSGAGGMSRRIFEGKLTDSALTFSYTLPHLADGFPGNLQAEVSYILTEDNALELSYRAVSDQDTVINLTNHSFFNLAGHASGSIETQILQISAGFYTPNTPDCIPTGEICSVAGTAFDFRLSKPLGQDIATGEQTALFGGYDHNLVPDGRGYRHVATAKDPVSGRTMETWTDLPGVQLYTSNGMRETGEILPLKDGAVYGNHQGFCLETQAFPNAVHMPWLQQPLYKAGQEYRSKTAYRFAW